MVTGEQRLDELDPVVQDQRDAVARLHAAGGEHRGEACGAIVKLRMGADVFAEDDGGPVRTGTARSTGQLRQHQSA